MTDNPLRGSVGPLSPVELPYGPLPAPTSTADSPTRAALLAVWLLLFVVGLIYISRYALTNPYVDEWEFIPVLFGDRPAGPWLWELHNEHRFPLPRAIYLGLFRLTGDLRTGCYVSFLGISLVAAGLMRLARQVRGRSSIADATFPLLLMHTGQAENLYMGYQLVFMLTAGLAAGLLAVIVRTTSGRAFERGLQAAVLGGLLLTCGAAGLAYGAIAAAWTVYLAARAPMARGHRTLLIALAALTPAYVAVYFQGYVRPGHHPPSAGVYESARVGLQAQAMAFGPSAAGVWPFVAVVLLVAFGAVVIQLARRARFRGGLPFVGLLLYFGAAAAVAFAIGWGRSGFRDDMGFAWRYGWLTAPAVWAAYFTWLLRAGRVSVYGPAALFAVALVTAPVNSASGFLDAERKVRPFEAGWEADVRAGLSADRLVEKHLPHYPAGARRDIADAVRRMRDRRYTYYESLGAEGP